jgi:hypothetical protein
MLKGLIERRLGYARRHRSHRADQCAPPATPRPPHCESAPSTLRATSSTVAAPATDSPRPLSCTLPTPAPRPTAPKQIPLTGHARVRKHVTGPHQVTISCSQPVSPTP